MINRMALFSDETQCFRTPYEPVKGDTVTIKLRTLKDDVLRAYAVINGLKKEMAKSGTEGVFDYYSVSIVCSEEPVSYYFVVYDEDDKVCYNKTGWAENNQAEYNFSFIPGFKVYTGFLVTLCHNVLYFNNQSSAFPILPAGCPVPDV